MDENNNPKEMILRLYTVSLSSCVGMHIFLKSVTDISPEKFTNLNLFLMYCYEYKGNHKTFQRILQNIANIMLFWGA